MYFKTEVDISEQNDERDGATFFFLMKIEIMNCVTIRNG